MPEPQRKQLAQCLLPPILTVLELSRKFHHTVYVLSVSGFFHSTFCLCVVLWMRRLFYFVERYSVVWIHHNLCIYFTGDGHLRVFFSSLGLLGTNPWTLLYHVIIFYRQRIWNLLPSLLVDQNWFQNHFSLLLFSSIISVNIFKY